MANTPRPKVARSRLWVSGPLVVNVGKNIHPTRTQKQWESVHISQVPVKCYIICTGSVRASGGSGRLAQMAPRVPPTATGRKPKPSCRCAGHHSSSKCARPDRNTLRTQWHLRDAGKHKVFTRFSSLRAVLQKRKAWWDIASGHATRASSAAGRSPRNARARAPAPRVGMSLGAVREPRPRHIFAANRQKSTAIIRERLQPQVVAFSLVL